MVRGPVHRLTTTLFVVLSLLFSQLALANYACPPDAPARNAPAMALAAAEPCESMGMAAGQAMDGEQPLLCHQHCVAAPLSFEPVPAPVLSLPAVMQVLLVPLLDAGATSSAVFADAGQERAPPDPLFLSTLRLRV